MAEEQLPPRRATGDLSLSVTVGEERFKWKPVALRQRECLQRIERILREAVARYDDPEMQGVIDGGLTPLCAGLYLCGEMLKVELPK